VEQIQGGLIMRKNYKNYAWRLEDIKDVCNSFGQEIIRYDSDTFNTLHEDMDIEDVVVRYIYDEDKFGYANLGDLFFMFDDCMYLITDDDTFKEYNNEDIPEIAQDMFHVTYMRKEKYVTRVIFAGVRTPYKDTLGDWIYTGDIVKGNYDIISGVCAFPPYNDDNIKRCPNNYGLMLDNHMLPLRECESLERLGTIYFDIAPNETEIYLEREIGGTAQHGVFDEEYLLKARHTPSYKKENSEWAEKAQRMEYNWRR
jgi:hypothetical protein